MYPARELSRLAARKVALRHEIARDRERCAEAAARVARPLVWLDRMSALWRRFAPLLRLAALPLGLLVTRRAFPRLTFLAPLLGRAFRAVCAVKASGRS